jgi:CBS-domain-containing membrane protein
MCQELGGRRCGWVLVGGRGNSVAVYSTPGTEEERAMAAERTRDVWGQRTPAWIDLPRVAEVMIARPDVHGATATVGELRAFFADDHVHMALLVDAGTLVGVVESSDLPASLDDGVPARSVSILAGRTIGPEAPAADAITRMKREGRRRLAVTDGRSRLLGLLCLKASGCGFCSAQDVTQRRDAHPAIRPTRIPPTSSA